MHPAERFFSSGHPLSSYLTIRSYDADGGKVTIHFDAPAAFVSGSDGRTLHSSLATLVLDTVLGGAVMGSLDKIQPIATVGLTTQHMRRPVAGEKLACSAFVEGIHADMAHVTGRLVSQADGQTLSTATGTFMIGTRATPIGERV
jgi:acyl-coenzyme A thioesterase PaaI-like protein